MTTASITIREARFGDLQGIVAIDAQRTGGEKPDYWSRIIDAYGNGAGPEGRIALVAEDPDGEVDGFLFGEIRAWEFGSERCGWIFSVAVRPEAARRGVATRLCSEAIHRFAEHGVSLVRTMIRRTDVPVLSLFRSLGFAAGPFNELEREVSVSAPAGEAS